MDAPAVTGPRVFRDALAPDADGALYLGVGDLLQRRVAAVQRAFVGRLARLRQEYEPRVVHTERTRAAAVESVLDVVAHAGNLAREHLRRRAVRRLVVHDDPAARPDLVEAAAQPDSRLAPDA